MSSASRGFRRRRSGGLEHIWPGFVDALAALLVVVIFVLLVFMVSQFYLSNLLSGRDQLVGELSTQINELADLLDLAREEEEELQANNTRLTGELRTVIGERDTLTADVESQAIELLGLTNRLGEADEQIVQLEQDREDLEASLADAFETVETDRETLEVKLAELASLEADLEALRASREQLEIDVATAALARQTLEDQVARLDTALDRSEGDKALLERTLDANQTTLEANAEELRERAAALAEIRTQLEENQSTLEARESVVRQLEERANTLVADLLLSREDRQQLLADLGTVRDRSTALETELADAQERTVMAQREIDERDIRLENLLEVLEQNQAALDEETRLKTEANQLLAELNDRLESNQAELVEETRLKTESAEQVGVLNEEVEALTERLDEVQSALEASEASVGERDLEIADLNARLNQALIRRVEELARYRSEFFGRLREVLGQRSDVQVVGDRFIFQSEVLFATGSAALAQDGQAQLAQLADTLQNVVAEFPSDVDWILRVDGHTDERPIRSPEFSSNWDLSAARAIEVVKYLISQGLPSDRLAAAGFGEYQPLDTARTEEAYRRNRRIELKFDQR